MTVETGGRVHAARILRDNPGLKPQRQALLASASADARKEAAAETGLTVETFPPESPFSLERIEDEAFLPVERRDGPRRARGIRQRQAD